MTAEQRSKDLIVPTGCAHDCGGACVLKAHVVDGRVTRFETDGGEEPQLRACVRGRSYRQRLYSPDRLRFPMKRVGERGEGKFELISWNEALDTTASELKRVRDRYGPASILCLYYSGSVTPLHFGGAIHRLLNLYGGCVRTWGSISGQGGFFAARATYGTLDTGNTRDDLVNSKLIILWGWNPANGIWTTNTSYHVSRAKEAGARVVCIDPRFTDSAAVWADQWLPIRPGTDAALLAAMAHVMITNNLHDQRFLDKYTAGFDRFKDYVLGKEDGVPKTPSWAEGITGAPAAAIEQLARDYATMKPAALIASFAPGRTAYGEQYHRAAMTLAAMTGNVGVHGGAAAGFEIGPLANLFDSRLPLGKNPAEPKEQGSANSLDGSRRSMGRIQATKVWDAMLRGKAAGYPSDIKLLYLAAANPLNQLLNTNRGVAALKRPEFIVAHEQFMTASARFADILLPVNTLMERNDLARPWMWGPYNVYLNKAVESPDETKSDFDIAVELAKRLGVAGFSDKTEDEWLREFVDTSKNMHITDYDRFKKNGVWKVKLPAPVVSLKPNIDEPGKHPFATPSGKIEIYSQRLAELNDPKLPAVPKYIETWESRSDPLARKYPLQLITIHSRVRAHSTFDNVPWLRELEPPKLWINSADAEARGIKDGQKIDVFNDRGRVRIAAKVTPRIMPGVVALGEGAWYTPDQNGVDTRGCPNVLTRDEHSPAGAFCSNTALVQVERTQSEPEVHIGLSRTTVGQVSQPARPRRSG